MRILVIGGSGVIGFETIKKLRKLGHDVFFTYYKNKTPISNGFSIDIRDANKLTNIFQKIIPDVVIHTTAITNVDLCETNKELATQVNVEGTSNIINECLKNKSKLVYISTSFVFDGTKPNYSEEDATSPTTFYGITKEKGEKLVKNSGLSFLILRTDLPYGVREKWQHTNSVCRTIDTIESGKIFRNFLNDKDLDCIKVDILTSLIYLNMSPMHHEPFDHFVYNFGKLSLYKILLESGKIHNEGFHNSKSFQ